MLTLSIALITVIVQAMLLIRPRCAVTAKTAGLIALLCAAGTALVALHTAGLL